MCHTRGVSRDTKAIIGTIISVGLVTAGLLLTQIAGVNTRIDDVGDDMREMRAEMRQTRTSIKRLDTRLDAVEIALGKLDRRLSTIERQVLPRSRPRSSSGPDPASLPATGSARVSA